MQSLLILLGAYFLGSLPTAVWVCKIRHGQDIRNLGSGNAGLTNVYRVFGLVSAIPVALVDLGKGMLAVLLGQVGLLWGLDSLHSGMICGLVAILGHSYTCFASFRGGKGVLTALGVYSILTPYTALFCFLFWAGIVKMTGLVSLASILAAIALPLGLGVQLFLGKGSWALFLSGLIIGGFVIWRHRSNIVKILQGTEHKFGRQASATNLKDIESQAEQAQEGASQP